MKKTILTIVALSAIIILVISGFRGQSGSPGTDWQNGISWDDPAISLNDIREGGQPVYLFVSTEWCTFCRKMKSQTFADPRVQTLLNELFVTLMINPELSGTANLTGERLTYADLARKLGVSGYPASFFFDAEGNLIGGQPGFIDAETFADLAEFVGDGHYTKRSFSEFQRLPADQRR